MINTTKIKQNLLDFTISGVEKFLKENPTLEFYAFAFDCNAEYCEVNLCFNTETDFQKTLTHYQSGKYGDNYQTDEEIIELKFNTGDWDYQCFDTHYVLEESELDEIYQNCPEDDDDKTWLEFVENLNELFCEVLLQFTQTETYQKIPKTKDFTPFCIDHDEDFETATDRLNKVRHS